MHRNPSNIGSVKREERPLGQCCKEIRLVDKYSGAVLERHIESYHVPVSTRKHDKNGDYDEVRCMVCGKRLLSYD